MQSNDEAKNILDYWKALEMLIPNAFPGIKTEYSKDSKYNLICNRISSDCNIKNIIENDNRKYYLHSEICGDIEICYGKFETKKIIDLLCDSLQVENNDVETDKGFVCLFALKITDRGTYIEESFDVSPFIWAVNECISNKCIDVKRMQPKQIDALKLEYENYLRRDEITIEQKIQYLYSELTGRLCRYITEDTLSFANVGVMIYDRQKKNEKGITFSSDRIEYSCLQQSHIIKDIEMVGEHLDENDDIIRYINAMKTEGKHLDIKDDLELVKQASAPELYSLGKWPSKYNPALMQQIAVNIACLNKKKYTSLEAQSIFSVNGPPGTGKTTLLKEVIVDNIVNRAIKLAEYDAADDAFTECHFFNSYDQYTTKYFKPDECLDDYIMLVASSNNNAVENITKELPKAGEVSDKNTLTGLFDVAKTKNVLVWEKNIDGARQRLEEPDIYFTYLAKELFGEDAWGLISVPLGNKKNIRIFFEEVLSKLIYRKNTDIKQFDFNFKKAKNDFIEQLDEVKRYRDEIISLNDSEWVAIEKLKHIEGEINELKSDIISVEEAVNDVDSLFVNVKSSLEEAEQQEQKILMQYSDTEQVIDELREEIISWQDRLKWFERLFPKLFFGEKHVRINELSEKKAQKTQELAACEEQLKTIKIDKEKINEQYQKVCAELEANKANLRKKNNQMEALLAKHTEYENEIDCCHKERYAKGIKSLLDVTDDNLSDKTVQESAFYSSKQYDEAREKLFFCAMQLHKWFVLSSSAIHTNFRVISKIWGSINDADNKPYVFESGDKKQAYEAVFKSLFLFVPVISTTFASVQSLLGSIRQPQKMGTLIVDEAGQAAPQLAVGALWRCKRALIVGDPTQIQPVVTIPDCIYKLVGEGIDLNYHKKTISIQNFADRLNIYAGKKENYLAGETAVEWVGCPLIIHRRCIEPMFSISNEIAYNGTMINATALPKADEANTLLSDCSKWIQIGGTEKGNKNHFVQEQGLKALDIVIAGLRKQNELPDIYIISPFKTVADEMKKLLRESREIRGYEKHDEWIKTHCGTVHTFQGKAAKEVIFLLGCDKDSVGTVNWVNVNIVNVAVTRAKYRLYVIGDYNIWKRSRFFQIVKYYIDQYKPV